MAHIINQAPATSGDDLSAAKKAILAVACVAAAIFALGAHWISVESLSLLYAAASTIALLGLTFLIRARARTGATWQLAFAFFVLGFVQLLNSLVQWFGIHVLHQPPTTGNPLASTVAGTVLIQLLESAVAILPILLLSRAFGLERASVFATRGRPTSWTWIGAALFVAMVAMVVFLPLTRLFPTRATIPLGTKLALVPALAAVALSNGFQEEFLFRGLFLRKYAAFFGRGGANALQAFVFALAHQGIGYTPFLLVFALAIILPLGLFGGWLMQRTDSVLAPSIVHGALDVAIYMAFLLSVA